MKNCRRCSETKPFSEFNNSRIARDRLDTYCRDCRRAIATKWRANNLQKSRALDRAQKQRERQKKGPEQVRREWKEWYNNNSDHRRQYQQSRNDARKQRARNAINTRIRSGKLTRPSTCSRCGKACRPDAHHSDHSKPLEVIWLCRSCHVLVERDKIDSRSPLR